MGKEYYEKALRESECVVKFIKKSDGSLRTMRCTLKPELLPERKTLITERKENQFQVRVFDLEKKEWRSFNINDVMYFDKKDDQ